MSENKLIQTTAKRQTRAKNLLWEPRRPADLKLVEEQKRIEVGNFRPANRAANSGASTFGLLNGNDCLTHVAYRHEGRAGLTVEIKNLWKGEWREKAGYGSHQHVVMEVWNKTLCVQMMLTKTVRAMIKTDTKRDGQYGGCFDLLVVGFRKTLRRTGFMCELKYLSIYPLRRWRLECSAG